MICQQTSLIPPHAKVIHEGGGRGFRCRGGVEGAGIGGEDGGDVFVEVAHFAGHGADDFGLVGGEVGECLGAFGMLDLWGVGVSGFVGERRRETCELVA